MMRLVPQWDGVEWQAQAGSGGWDSCPTLPKGRKEFLISHLWLSCCRAGIVLFVVLYFLAVSPFPKAKYCRLFPLPSDYTSFFVVSCYQILCHS